MNAEGDEADFEFAGEVANRSADGAGGGVDARFGRNEGLDAFADGLKGFGAGSARDDLHDGEAGSGGLLDAESQREAAEGFGGEVAGEEDVAGAFFVPIGLVTGAADGEDRDGDVADEALGGGAEEDAVDAAASVGGEDEEVDGLMLEGCLDVFEDGTLAEEDRAGDSLVGGQLAQVVEIVLEVEFQLHQGAGKDVRHAVGGFVGHDVHEDEGGVIDFGDGDGAVERDEGSVGKVDGNEDSVGVGESDGDGACEGKWVGSHTSASGHIMLGWMGRVSGVGHNRRARKLTSGNE